jgi:hypothetical protein
MKLLICAMLQCGWNEFLCTIEARKRSLIITFVHCSFRLNENISALVRDNLAKSHWTFCVAKLIAHAMTWCFMKNSRLITRRNVDVIRLARGKLFFLELFFVLDSREMFWQTIATKSDVIETGDVNVGKQQKNEKLFAAYVGRTIERLRLCLWNSEMGICLLYFFHFLIHKSGTAESFCACYVCGWRNNGDVAVMMFLFLNGTIKIPDDVTRSCYEHENFVNVTNEIRSHCR